MNKSDMCIDDRVQTIKGIGVIIAIYETTVLVELDGDHGTYLFHKDSVWEII
jgi:hypothetical protein